MKFDPANVARSWRVNLSRAIQTTAFQALFFQHVTSGFVSAVTLAANPRLLIPIQSKCPMK